MAQNGSNQGSSYIMIATRWQRKKRHPVIFHYNNCLKFCAFLPSKSSDLNLLMDYGKLLRPRTHHDVSYHCITALKVKLLLKRERKKIINSYDQEIVENASRGKKSMQCKLPESAETRNDKSHGNI